MLSLGRVDRALNLVRSGHVFVSGRVLNRLLSIYVDAHSNEFFTENDIALVKQIELKGLMHGQTIGRDSRAGHC